MVRRILCNKSNLIAKHFPNVCKGFSDDLLIDVILSNPVNVRFLLNDERLRDLEFLNNLLEVLGNKSEYGKTKIISLLKNFKYQYLAPFALRAIAMEPECFKYSNKTKDECKIAAMSSELKFKLTNKVSSISLTKSKLVRQGLTSQLKYLGGEDRTKKKIKEFKRSPEVIAMNIDYFRVGELSPKDALSLVSKFPRFLKNLPNRLKTKQVCETAVFQVPELILDARIKTKAMILTVLTSGEDRLVNFATKLPNGKTKNGGK